MSLKQLLMSKEYWYHKENGERLLQEGALGEARLELEKAIFVLRSLKSDEEAYLESLLQSIAQRVAQINLSRARQEWAEGHLDQALDYFQNALGIVRTKDTKEEILIEISRLKMEMENKNDQDCGLVVPSLDASLEDRFTFAMQLCLNGQFDRAILELTRLLDQDPDNEEILLRLGNALFDSKRFLEAEHYYHVGLNLDGEMAAQFCYRLGEICKEVQEWDQALKWYEKCLEREEGHVDALLSMGYVYKKLSKRDKAIDIYERVVALDPEDIKTLLVIADLWAEGGYVKNAREIWREILEKDCDEEFINDAKERLSFYEINY